MANIFDTAKYILEQSGYMSPMKLQQLCYYSQTMCDVFAKYVNTGKGIRRSEGLQPR